MKRDLAVLGALVLVALALFSPILNGFFLSDDFFLVKAALGPNPFGLLTFGGIFFRPAAAISFWIDAHVWGLRPFGFHLTNVALHAVASFAVLKIGESLALTSRASLLAAVLFLVAPSHSEPVTWIACRMDLLATAAGLLAIWLWLVKRRLPSLALLVCAMFAKESASSVALVMVAIELRAGRSAWCAMPLALLGIYVVVRRCCMGQWIGGYGAPGDQLPDSSTMAANLIPFTLRALLGHFPGDWLPLQAVVLPASARLRNFATRPIPFLAIAYLLTLLPVLGLGLSYSTVEGERYLYLPSAMLFLIAGALVSHRRALAAVLILFSVCSLEHSLSTWRAAGKLTQSLLPKIAAAAKSSPIVLLNVPDNLRGAYVFRNGLPEALALFHPTAYPVTLSKTRVHCPAWRYSAGEIYPVDCGD